MADTPVQVPWIDAQAYARWASKALPTSAQWTVHEEILSSLEATLLQTVAALEEMSRSPRRTAADTIRGPTTTIVLPDGRQMTVPTAGFPTNAFEMLNRGPRRGDSVTQAKPPLQPKKPPV